MVILTWSAPYAASCDALCELTPLYSSVCQQFVLQQLLCLIGIPSLHPSMTIDDTVTASLVLPWSTFRRFLPGMQHKSSKLSRHHNLVLGKATQILTLSCFSCHPLWNKIIDIINVIVDPGIFEYSIQCNNLCKPNLVSKSEDR